MPTARFKVTVSSEADTSDTALLDAGRYLAYADQSDMFGYHGRIDDTKVNLHNGEWFITIEFAAPVATESELERWRTEMDLLSGVEEAECITNPIDR